MLNNLTNELVGGFQSYHPSIPTCCGLLLKVNSIGTYDTNSFHLTSKHKSLCQRSAQMAKKIQKAKGLILTLPVK